MTKNVNHPVPEVNIRSLTATKQGVNNCSIFRSVMVTAKKVVLSSQCQTSQAILRKIVVYAVPGIQMIPA